MSDIFPKWTNRLPLYVILGGLLVGSAAIGGIWYYFTPKYTRVGYMPKQPVAFSHTIHAGELGIDCRYCHSHVEKSWFSNVPATGTCINCHGPNNGGILKDDPRLALVRQSAETGEPIPWKQVHKVPDYVYFNHSVHVNRGISCVECHGEVQKMDEVWHAKPLSMAFCLDCHRDPESRVRPLEEITNLEWSWSDDPNVAATKQKAFGKDFVEHAKIHASQNCSACHR